MGVMLDAVSLEDWRGVVKGAVQAAKGGDAQARNWLAQYLMGKPDSKAPSPLNIMVQQLNGTTSLLDKLAHDVYWKEAYPGDNDAYMASLKAQLSQELQQKIKLLESIENPEPVRPADESDPKVDGAST